MEPQHIADAENYLLAQFEVHEMLSGRRDPQLGRAPKFSTWLA
jgi:hypothetical protein